MAFRASFAIDKTADLKALGATIDQAIAPIMRDCLNEIELQAKQNLSGVPFTSQTGTWTIQKRTGRGAASVQTQYPYGSPFRGRVFADSRTRYADNPEEYNYLAILERGRGEVKPKYTPSMRAGNSGRARLVIPGGPYQLVSGRYGFRGQTGSYRFVRSLPPMEGRYWLEAAAQEAEKAFPEIVRSHLGELLN